MRIFALIFALTASSLAVDVEIIDLTNRYSIQPYIFENKVIKFSECIRDILKNGVQEWGVPPLDPLDIGDFNLDLDALQVQGLAGHIIGKDIKSSGASAWSMDKLKISITIFPVGAKVRADINWPRSLVSGTYDIDAEIFGHTIKGQGDYNSELANFRIVVDSRTATFPIAIKSAKLKVSVDNSTASMGTLSVDDLDIAETLVAVGNRLPEIMKKHSKLLNNVFSDYAIPVLNKIIKRVVAKEKYINVNEIPIIGKCLPKK